LAESASPRSFVAPFVSGYAYSSSRGPIAFGVYPFALHNGAALDPLLHRVDGGMIRVWAAVARGQRHRICSPWHWLRAADQSGYGAIGRAHRAAWPPSPWMLTAFRTSCPIADLERRTRLRETGSHLSNRTCWPRPEQRLPLSQSPGGIPTARRRSSDADAQRALRLVKRNQVPDGLLSENPATHVAGPLVDWPTTRHRLRGCLVGKGQNYQPEEQDKGTTGSAV
jgi:hypothetical protein